MCRSLWFVFMIGAAHCGNSIPAVVRTVRICFCAFVLHIILSWPDAIASSRSPTVSTKLFFSRFIMAAPRARRSIGISFALSIDFSLFLCYNKHNDVLFVSDNWDSASGFRMRLFLYLSDLQQREILFRDIGQPVTLLADDQSSAVDVMAAQD